jgi:hypothetical protein
MGMIVTYLKKTPEGKTPLEFCNECHRNVANLIANGDSDGDRPEGGNASILKLEAFEEQWNTQENLRKNSEVKEKYRQLTAQGQVIVIEIDW